MKPIDCFPKECVHNELVWWYSQNKDCEVVIKFKPYRNLTYYIIKNKKDEFVMVIYYPRNKEIGYLNTVKKVDYDLTKGDSVKILFKDKELYEELYGSFVLEGI